MDCLPFLARTHTTHQHVNGLLLNVPGSHFGVSHRRTRKQ